VVAADAIEALADLGVDQGARRWVRLGVRFGYRPRPRYQKPPPPSMRTTSTMMRMVVSDMPGRCCTWRTATRVPMISHA